MLGLYLTGRLGFKPRQTRAMLSYRMAKMSQPATEVITNARGGADLHIYLREWRVLAGITQEQLAERLGVRHATISRWESGKRPILLPMLWRIAQEIVPNKQPYTLFFPPAPSILAGVDADAEHQEEREILAVWRQLTPQKRELLHAILQLILDL
jgi:transcriptional regulator with XRE-family HTH domain